MQRIASFIGLILLILAVILSYFYLIEPNYLSFFSRLESMSYLGVLDMNNDRMVAGEQNSLLYTSWVFIGIFILIFLKITWKLIIYNWGWNRFEDENNLQNKYKPSG